MSGEQVSPVSLLGKDRGVVDTVPTPIPFDLRKYSNLDDLIGAIDVGLLNKYADGGAAPAKYHPPKKSAVDGPGPSVAPTPPAPVPAPAAVATHTPAPAPVPDTHTAAVSAPVPDTHTAAVSAPVPDTHTAAVSAPVPDTHTAATHAPAAVTQTPPALSDASVMKSQHKHIPQLASYWSSEERNILLVWAETTTTMTVELEAALG